MPPEQTSADPALARSARLWPDPFFAPDVPPRRWLERWFEGREDHDLLDQMTISPNCRRAGEAYREERLAQLLIGQPEPPTEETGPEPAPDAADRAVGTLVETTGEVRLFDADRGQTIWRLGRPPTAFLVQGPREMRHDHLWRAVFAVPEFTVPEWLLGDDEIVLRVGDARWLAFPSLEYPLSAGQITRVAGRATERGVELLLLALGALAEGLPLPPRLAAGRAGAGTTGRPDHLARQLEEASWLAAEADARLAEAEWTADLQTALKEPEGVRFFAAQPAVAPVVFARGNEVITPVFCLPSAEGDTWGKTLSRRLTPPSGQEGLIATMKQRPADLGNGRLSALWKLNRRPPDNLVSRLVAVVNSQTREVLGAARLDEKDVVRWEAATGAMGETPAEQVALIIFLRP